MRKKDKRVHPASAEDKDRPNLRNAPLAIPLDFEKAVEGLANVRIEKPVKPPKSK